MKRRNIVAAAAVSIAVAAIGAGVAWAAGADSSGVVTACGGATVNIN